jgi:autophagy-related protein 13
LRIYRSVSSTPPPPFELQVLLSVPELTSNQVLVYQAPDSSRVRIEPTPRHILLETWLLVFSPTPSSPSSSSRQQQQYRYGEVDSSASTSSSSGEVAPSTIYKHCITLFRSLFSLLRILPAWRLHKRLRRRTGGGNRNGSLGIRLRVRGLGMDEGDSIAVDESILGFGK